jgi:hypothetical protein
MVAVTAAQTALFWNSLEASLLAWSWLEAGDRLELELA